MNNIRTLILGGMFVVAAVVFTGCTTLDMLADEAVSGMIRGSDSTPRSSRTQESTETTEPAGDPVDEPRTDEDSPFSMGDGSLTALPPAFAFQVVYGYTFLFGDAATARSALAPGEGARWLLTWRDAAGTEDHVELEYARLTGNEDAKDRTSGE